MPKGVATADRGSVCRTLRCRPRSRRPRSHRRGLPGPSRPVHRRTRRGATVAQTAVAWTLARGPHVIAVPGTRDFRHLHENTAAGTLRLTGADLRQLDAVSAPAGNRY
ncbi:aldo/keto reductase [Kitasatospora sp. NPDC088134]|uniref:aldo/keto reductase n=1 Tax=Kitasatospora sp. NPDC088134 TaxID=3364071 RepID=UPI0037F7D0A7